MAAPRKYSDAQRQAMYRLYEAGKSPGEITSLCEQGMAGVTPFQIPRRTAHEILTRMADEAEQKLPTSVLEVESAEAVDRFPVRIAAKLDREISRLDQKQGLTLKDLDLLKKMAEISFDLHKRLSRRAPSRTGSRTTRQGATGRQEPEGAIEKLAREQREREGEDFQPTNAHTRLDDDPTGAEKVDPPALARASLAPVPQASPVGRPAEEPQRAPAEKAEAAEKARAALALN